MNRCPAVMVGSDLLVQCGQWDGHDGPHRFGTSWPNIGPPLTIERVRETWRFGPEGFKPEDAMKEAG